MFSQKGKNEIPADEAVKYALEHSNLYQNQELCRILLLDVENGDSKEKLATQNLTIEHIMPQTLSKGWKQYISDKDHEKYVHTLGNLSITGYNSEMSNKSFEEKKQILKQNSRIQILNRDVLDKDKWTIEAIKDRASNLSNVLIQKYQIKRITDPTIEFEAVDKISLADPNLAKGRKSVSFTLEGSNYSENTFKQILIDVAQLLDQDNPQVLESVVGITISDKIDLKDPNKQLIVSGDNYSDDGKFDNIRDDFYVLTNLSAINIMRVIKLFLKHYHVDENEFSILIKKHKEAKNTF